MDGIRVQPLLAGSGGDAIRIHGMPGRYTKILSDGLPVFGATPEGLEPLQTSALGLDHVEVVKGVTSSLAGPTALGGIVNFVSAPPTGPSEIVVNGTSHEASDIALWQTHTFDPRWSASLLAGRHYANPDDPDGDGWAEISGYKRVVVRPRVYWARSDQSNWFMTGGWTSENRRSGTFESARLPDFNRFSDDADTRRADAGTVGRILLDTNTFLTVRASMTREWRTRWVGDDRERDRRNTIFGDVSLTKTRGANVLVTGAAFERDQFNALDTREFSYRYTTPALFAEHTWTPQAWFGVTSGARLDLQSELGDFVSPRVSVLVRPTETWTARLSASSGVYAPTPLTDETLGFGLAHLRPTTREAEHATGWSLDVDNMRGALELRGSAYRTVIKHPVVLRTRGEELALVNADESAHTQGIDLSARYRMRPFRFTASYSYVDASQPAIGEIVGEDFAFDTTMHRPMALDPRHSARVDAAYDRENDRLLGVELAFTGPQTLSDSLATTTQSYMTIDARFEKHIGPAILFVRGQNLLGVHQRQFAPVLLAASGAAGEWSGDAWAPLEGRVLNAGLRLRY
jgi:iron complex outermembrane receptor protein